MRLLMCHTLAMPLQNLPVQRAQRLFKRKNVPFAAQAALHVLQEEL